MSVITEKYTVVYLVNVLKQHSDCQSWGQGGEKERGEEEGEREREREGVKSGREREEEGERENV